MTPQYRTMHHHYPIAMVLLLVACGGVSDPVNPSPAPAPTTTADNADPVVACSEAGVPEAAPPPCVMVEALSKQCGLITTEDFWACAPGGAPAAERGCTKTGERYYCCPPGF